MTFASEVRAQGSGEHTAQFTPRPSPLFRELDRPAQPFQEDTSNVPRTHAVTGAIIGGAVVGSVGAYYAYHGPFGNEKCVGCAVGGLVLGGLIGAVTGGLIGGLFPQ